MPRKIYDMLGLPPLETCYFDVPLADVARKAPLNINSHSRKVWSTSLERGRNYFLNLFLEQIMNLMLHRLILLDFHFLRPA
jgi:hypothetical protein